MMEITTWAIANLSSHFGTEAESLESWQLAFAATQDRYPWLVHMTDGKLDGFARAGRFRDRSAYAWTTEVSVFVAPERQRRGVARLLYERLFPILVAQGFQTAIAGITLPNDASVALHRAFGFTQVGQLHRAGFKLGAWHDVSYWQRDLGIPGSTPRQVRRVSDVEPGER